MSDQQKIKWLEAASQLPPIPPRIQSAFTLLPCCNCWKCLFPLVWLCIHSFTSLLHSWFSGNNCPHAFFLLYHPLHYLLTGWALFVAKMVQRNLNACYRVSSVAIRIPEEYFFPHSSVWFTWQFCRSCFSCCLPELGHSSLPSNLLSRFTA